MENNPEQIPSYIFDWLELLPFEGLSASRQEEVLRYFSADAYNELHHTVSDIRHTAHKPADHMRNTRKQMLMQRFDEKHKPQATIIRMFNKPVALWKAAAVFLLIGGGWFSYFMLQHKHLPASTLTTFVDTLYVTKEISPDPLKIYDTVYIDRVSEPAQKQRRHQQSKQQQHITGADMDQLNIVSVKELEHLPNSTKRNSMKDDSLVKQYSFITL